MAEVKFEDNSNKFLSALKKEAVPGALTRIGMEAEGNAKDRCPVLTGLARNSITYALYGQSAAVASYRSNDGSKGGRYSGNAPAGTPAVYVGSNVEYFPDIELGNSKRKAKPCLKPAISEHQQTYRNIIQDELKNG